MKSDPQSRLNADQLDSALAHKREGLAELENEEQRSRREQAIAQMATYASMRVASSEEEARTSSGLRVSPSRG